MYFSSYDLIANIDRNVCFHPLMVLRSAWISSIVQNQKALIQNNLHFEPFAAELSYFSST